MASVQGTDQSPVVSAIRYAKEVAANISRSFHWFGRKVTRFTNKKMSPPLAKIVQASYRALPFAAMRLIVPFPWFLFPAAAVIVYRSIHAAPSFEDLKNGTALGCAGLGTIQCIRGLVHVNPLQLASGISNVAVAAYLFSNTFGTTANELQTKQQRRKGKKECVS